MQKAKPVQGCNVSLRFFSTYFSTGACAPQAPFKITNVLHLFTAQVSMANWSFKLITDCRSADQQC